MTKTASQKARAKRARSARVAKARQVVVVSNPTPRPRRRRARVNNSVRKTTMLSKCAGDYIRTVENPFSGQVACVPTIMNVPSDKRLYRTRGVMYSGTNTYGFIYVNPRSCGFYDTNLAGPGDPPPAVVFTLSTFAGSAVPGPAEVGTMINTLSSGYSIGNPGYVVSLRQVALGIRVRNITPMLNRGGRVLAVESPAHYSLIGTNIDQLGSIDQAGTGSIDGAWTSVVFHPSDADEYDYFNAAGLGTNATPNAFNVPVLCIAVTAPVGTPQTYEFEVNAVFEATGRNVHGTTPSPSDPVGLGAAQNAHMDIESRKPRVGDRTAWAQSQFQRAAMSVGANLMSGAVNEAVRRVGNWLNPPRTPLIEEL